MVLRALAVPLQRSDGSWPAVDALTPAQRQRLDARTGNLLEHLALAPDILPMPPSTAPT